MKGSDFDEAGFFSAIGSSGSRALLIGRRAMVVLGLPVLTADYDFWIHIEDIELFNAAASQFGLEPSKTPGQARQRGRYVLENDEHVDVLVARSVPTVQGIEVKFEELWKRKVPFEAHPGVLLDLPSLDDLIATKRFSGRARDKEDIRLLEILKEGAG